MILAHTVKKLRVTVKQSVSVILAHTIKKLRVTEAVFQCS